MRTTQTTKSGDYTFTLLQIGSYEVKVAANGFKTYAAQNIRLMAGDRARVDAKMTIGATSENVSVSAEAAPMLQTDSSTVGSTIPERNVQEVPLNGRNLTDLVLMSAGVSGSVANSLSNGSRQDDSRASSAYVVNGQSDLNQNNQIDGMDNNERRIGVVEVKPSIDGIQEVTVQTSMYTAETGRTAGGVVQIVTKSGTNQFHGSAYEFLRNNYFDAWSKFATYQPILKQNQFGGSLGGPILKKKTFFFGDYEGLRQVSTTPATSTVPSAALEAAVANGDLATIDTLLANNGDGATGDEPTITNGATALTMVAAGSINPIAKSLFALYPKPTNADGSNCQTGVNYCTNQRKTQNSNTFDTRIDQHFNDNNTLNGRVSYNKTVTSTASPFPAVGGVTQGGVNAQQPEMNISANYIHVFKPTLVLNLKGGYTYSKNFYMPSDPQNVATTMGFDCDAANCINTTVNGATNGLPGISVSGLSRSVAEPTQLGEAGWVPLLVKDNTFQYIGSLTWSKGAHSFKFGVTSLRRQIMGVQSQNTYGSLGFYTIGDLLVGNVASKARVIATDNPHLRTWEPSAYAQDDWRIKSWLTLNLGIRYDIYTPYTEVNGYISNFDPNQELLISPDLLGAQHSSKTAGVPTDYTNLQPRIGFSASLPHGYVLRGGFGTTYFPNTLGPNATLQNAPYQYSMSCAASILPPGQTSSTLAFGAAGLCQNVTSSMKEGLPDPIANISLATDPTTYAGTTINAIPVDLKSSLLIQYSLQAQKEWRQNVISVGYVGNLGRHLANFLNLNQPTPNGVGDASNYLYPSLTVNGSAPTIDTLTSYGTSNYNALQASFQRRATKGLTTSINYTWSHTLNDAELLNEGGGMNPQCTRAGCVVDLGLGLGTHVSAGPSEYDYGNGQLDIRHRVTALVTYTLPFAKNAHGLLAVVAKGWNTNLMGTYQSGMPFQIQLSTAQGPPGSSATGWAGVPGGADGSPNQTCSAKRSHKNSADAVNAWFDVSCFTLQKQYTFGNSRKDQVFGPGQENANISLVKETNITEALRLQFRAEVFNITNTPALGQPGGSFAASNFCGTGISSCSLSDLQASPSTYVGTKAWVDTTSISRGAVSTGGPPASYPGAILTTVGTPRQMQFALKLLF
jgi:hypothetical protein